MKKLKILVINLDNLEFTKTCLKDLSKQTNKNFDIVLVDQNSKEEGTKVFLDSLFYDNLEIIRNKINKPLHDVWNWFANTYENEYLCFLNNDVELATNFVESIIEVFDKEPKVGIVVHTTNHEKYDIESNNLNYIVVEPFKYMQGWDFSIRKEIYPNVPSYLKTYCGDDYIFNNIYEQGYNLAYILSSPMIHYEGQSKKSMTTNGYEDHVAFKQHNNKHYLSVNFYFSKIKPTFSEIKKYNMETLKLWYEESIKNPNKNKSIDIYEHLETLKKYGSECEHITEMGVRWGASTLAFIQANPKKLVSYDIKPTIESDTIINESKKYLNHHFIIGDTLSVSIEQTDLLFIDTLHTYNQLFSELNLHADKVRKYIILHDTTTFGRIDEQIYEHASQLIKTRETTKKGLRTAMEDFLNENENWVILEDKTNNNGLTILHKNG